MRTFLKIIFLVLLIPASGSAGAEENSEESKKLLRVISLAPAVTELIYALGREDTLVGVTKFCDYPPEARTKPKIGGIVDPNLEAILALAPDYIIYAPSLTSKLENFTTAKSQKIPVAYERIEDVFETILTLGRVLDADEKAKNLKSRLSEEIEKVGKAGPESVRPKALFVISRDAGALSNIYAAGTRSYLHELLEIAGAENIYGDIDRNYLHVSVESIIERDPEIIFDVHQAMASGEEKAAVKLAAEWEMLPVRAARRGQVHILPGDEFVRPGPRMINALRSLASAIQGHSEGPSE